MQTHSCIKIRLGPRSTVLCMTQYTKKPRFTSEQTIHPPKVPQKPNFIVILYCMDLDTNANCSSWIIGPKIWSSIPEKLKSSSPYSFGKIYKKVLLSCQTSCWSLFYMLVTFCLIFGLYSCHILWYCADATIFPPIYLYSCSPHPLYIGMLFPTAFCCCFYAYFTWSWFDAFYYYL